MKPENIETLKTELLCIFHDYSDYDRIKQQLEKFDDRYSHTLNMEDGIGGSVETEVHYLDIGEGNYYSLQAVSNDMADPQRHFKGPLIIIGNIFTQKVFPYYFDAQNRLQVENQEFIHTDALLDQIDADDLDQILKTTESSEAFYALSKENKLTYADIGFEALWKDAKRIYQDHMEWNKYISDDQRYHNDSTIQHFYELLDQLHDRELRVAAPYWLQETNYDFINGDNFNPRINQMEKATYYFIHKEEIQKLRQNIENYKNDDIFPSYEKSLIESAGRVYNAKTALNNIKDELLKKEAIVDILQFKRSKCLPYQVPKKIKLSQEIQGYQREIENLKYSLSKAMQHEEDTMLAHQENQSLIQEFQNKLASTYGIDQKSELYHYTISLSEQTEFEYQVNESRYMKYADKKKENEIALESSINNAEKLTEAEAEIEY